MTDKHVEMLAQLVAQIAQLHTLAVATPEELAQRILKLNVELVQIENAVREAAQNWISEIAALNKRLTEATDHGLAAVRKCNELDVEVGRLKELCKNQQALIDLHDEQTRRDAALRRVLDELLRELGVQRVRA